MTDVGTVIAAIVSESAPSGHGFSGSGVASQIFTLPSTEPLTRRWPAS